MRGLSVEETLLFKFPRITPAHAGTIFSALKFELRTWDHPRACGDYLSWLFFILLRLGSPPRMRGLCEYPWRTIFRAGITPAHAGTIFFVLNPPLVILGSPPRMRGLSFCKSDIFQGVGITPAHAGTIAFGFLGRLYLRDHPRACGDYRKAKFNGGSVPGSPPRMRGLFHSFSIYVYRGGITPAHAGTIIGDEFIVSSTRDHPRACGDYHFAKVTFSKVLGSPPRMRGLFRSL